MKRALFLVALGLLVAGCGGGDDNEATPTEAHVYYLRDGKVWPVAREIEGDQIEAEALGALFLGPTDGERQDLGAETATTTGSGASMTVEDGVAHLEPETQYSRNALAQIVYTLTQFETVESVEIDGETYTRADFEDQTPAILVESPLPFAEVTSPVTASGTANTFEATFNYEVTDTDGRIVDERFVTATSGTGTRGTFDFTTNEFEIPFDGVGALIVFEISAEDGSRRNVVEIPLRMSQ